MTMFEQLMFGSAYDESAVIELMKQGHSPRKAVALLQDVRRLLGEERKARIQISGNFAVAQILGNSNIVSIKDVTLPWETPAELFQFLRTSFLTDVGAIHKKMGRGLAAAQMEEWEEATR